MLLILILLGLLAASFAFRVQAEWSATRARVNEMQTRLAAEAGIQKVMLMLRTQRLDVDAWYDNPDELHRVIVWSSVGGREAYGTTSDDDEGKPAYRFTIVADDPTDDKVRVRYGITDETSKLNLNTASEEQLRTLFSRVLPPDVVVQDLVDALLDWIDGDDDVRGYGAEREHYASLEPPYRPKNGPLDTIEELLMVKGFTGQVLYGEDYDRNGLLTPNEDDGDTNFPPDNTDGKLDRGLYPYITVLSRDLNRANDNKPRVLLAAGEALDKKLEEVFDDPAKADAVRQKLQEITQAAAGGGGGGGAGQGKNGKKEGDKEGGKDSGTGEGKNDGGGSGSGSDSGSKGGATNGGGAGAGGGTPGSRRGDSGSVKDPGGGRPGAVKPPADSGGQTPTDQPIKGKDSPRLQTRQATPTRSAADALKDAKGDGSVPQQGGLDAVAPTDEADGRKSGEGKGGDGSSHTGMADDKSGGEDQNPDGQSSGEQADAGQTPAKPSPADLLRPGADGEPPKPLTDADLPILLDNFTTLAEPELLGVININTAEAPVLMTLPGVDEALAQSIIQQRDQLDVESKKTTAWLITQGVLDFDQFDAIYDKITARGTQFTIEALGYADHIGAVTRLQAIIEMRGPLGQVLYYRDLTALGAPYKLRGKKGDYELAGVHR